MKPNQILALCASIDAAIQLYSVWHGTFSITGFIGIFIAVALLWKDKFSFRAYRFYLWVVFLVTLFFVVRFAFGWTNIPTIKGSAYTELHIPPIVACLIWAAVSGVLLYYTDTDKVRRAFKLPPKRSRTNADDGNTDRSFYAPRDYPDSYRDHNA